MIEESNLHDLLLGGLGIELPIRGGYGGSRQDPIVITARDADGVALARLLTLHAVGRGRGIFWRTVAQILLGDEWPGIEQFKVETVQLTETQMITRTENFYFDVSAAMAARRRWTSPPVIAHHDVSGLTFPFEIGWLHFDKGENNELDTPGLGHSLGYTAPGIACSLYVYDRGLATVPDDVTNSVVQDEFEEAAREIATYRPDFEALVEQPAPSQDCLERYYRVGDAGRQASLLWLTTSRGRFIRARVTWVRDQFIDEAALNFINAVLANIRNSGPLPTRGVH
ncbi:MAG: hypothetical protein FWD12_11405 [Alphaproteobacteria bacterium]|nr:hypothetical protein [Alphaproteobacteria bacterium]